MSAHCGWHMSRARHMTCALARHRSECEFYLEHFVVQLYIYVVCILCIYTFCCTAVSICCLYFVVQLYLHVVCILCIYTLVYFLFKSFAHSRQFLHLYLSISVRIVYSFAYFWHGILILFISIVLFNSIIL